MNATNKSDKVAQMVKIWENKNAQRAVRGAALSTMALSLAACGGGSSTPEAAAPEVVTPVAQTYTLTAGIDTVAAGDGNDTINAGLNANSTQTLQGLDSVNGGDGTDTMNVVFNTAGTYAPSLTSIETVNLTSSAAITLDMVGAASASTIKSVGSTGAVTINNIASTSANVTIQSTAVNHTLDYANASTAGTSDAATVTVSGMTAGTLSIDTGIETVSLVSAGSANTLAGLTSGANTLNISGDQAITITAANTTSETIDASAATGAVTVTSNNTNATTITTGSGADSVTLTGGAAVVETVSTGAGNDTVTFTANLANADVLNGGDGTDTLAGISANLVALTAVAGSTDNISGFETVRVTDALGANLTLANVQAGINTVRLDSTAAGRTITFEAGAKAIDLRAAVGGAVTVNDTGSATTDSLTLTNNAAATDIFNTNNLIVGGFETVTYAGSGTGAATSQDFGVITITADTGGTSTLNLTGSNAVSTTGAITANVIDASGLTAQATGTATFTMGAAAVGVTTITGSAGDDTLLGDAASTINGGEGNDTVTGGTGNDTLNGGAGNDTITTNTGNDTVDGGAGNDVVNTDAALSALDVIVGGEGTDTLAIDAAATAATAVGVSGFERLRTDTGLTQDMAVFTNNATFNSLDNNGVAGVFTNVSDNVTALHNTASGSTASITRLVDGTANALTIYAQDTTTGSEGATAWTTVTANNEETITLVSGSNTAETLTITTLAASDLTTLTLTGTAAVTVTNAVTGGTALATVDATGLAGAATVDATSSTVAVTMTAGAGGATFTGGVGADTITGGAGVDVLVGGTGNDTINGGGGADTTINGGIGADTLTGGAGDDNFVQALTQSVVATAVVDASTGNAMAAGATIAVGDTITFGNGVDVITDFTAGGTVDDVNVNTAGAATSALGLAENALDGTAGAGGADDILFLSGTWNAATKTFTVAANGAGADTMILDVDADTVGQSLLTSTSLFILQGVDSDDLVAADFI